MTSKVRYNLLQSQYDLLADWLLHDLLTPKEYFEIEAEIKKSENLFVVYLNLNVKVLVFTCFNLVNTKLMLIFEN